jgi:Tn3 transposase DDE domain
LWLAENAHPAAWNGGVVAEYSGNPLRLPGCPQYRASGLALVTAAIALWNTVYLGRALDGLRCGGEIIADPLLSHLAPVGWQHINLTGDYLWDADSSLGPDGFRSLRTTATNLRPVLAA